LLVGNGEIEEAVDGVDVGRNRNFDTVHLRHHLVIPPLPRVFVCDVGPDMIFVCMEEMRTIFVHKQPRLFLNEVVAISPNVLALLDHQHPSTQLRGTPLGQNSSAHPRPHNNYIPRTPQRTWRRATQDVDPWRRRRRRRRRRARRALNLLYKLYYTEDF
jgi:hypothetical protein